MIYKECLVKNFLKDFQLFDQVNQLTKMFDKKFFDKFIDF